MINHQTGNLIAGQKTQRNRENKEIAHAQSYKKQQGRQTECQSEAVFFQVVNGRSHKLPDFKKQVGKTDDQSEQKGNAHVDEELGGQPDVDDLKLKTPIAKGAVIGKMFGDQTE